MYIAKFYKKKKRKEIFSGYQKKKKKKKKKHTHTHIYILKFYF